MPPSPVAPGGDAWLRGRRFWEFSFLGVLGVTCVVVAVSESPNLAVTSAALLLLLGQAPAYLLLGRATFLHGRPHPRRWHYLLLVIGLFLPAAALAPTAAFALFALAPLCYMIVHPLAASIAMAVLNVVPITSIVYDDEATRQEVIQAVAAIGGGVVVSLAFGMWIHRIVEQSQERARLIRRLDETRAELAEVSRHTGALEERRHMAREIHDTLAQGFTSIVMLLRAAEAEPSSSGHYIQLARRSAQDNLDDARALISGSLDTVRLPESLRRVTDRVGEELGIDIGCEIGGTERELSPHVEIALLRVAQEALANVRKHANATEAHLDLEFTADTVRLHVHDKGSGFDPTAIHDGHGLAGIRERVRHTGGTADIASTPGTGTTITVELPT